MQHDNARPLVDLVNMSVFGFHPLYSLSPAKILIPSLTVSVSAHFCCYGCNICLLSSLTPFMCSLSTFTNLTTFLRFWHFDSILPDFNQFTSNFRSLKHQSTCATPPFAFIATANVNFEQTPCSMGFFSV